MREIKFRAWDTVNQRFFELIETRVAEMTHSYKDGVIYSQYTGLKDKNGKEIYEGDIVKARSKYVNVVYEVYWEEHGCQFRCCANHDRQFDKTHPMFWADEVIGTIWENPELLKGGK